MNKWFRTWSLENWKALLAGNMLLHCLPLLPSPYDTLHFEFFGKRLRDQSEKVPRHILGLEICKYWLSSPLGKEYVNCCVDNTLKRHATSLAKEIVDAAIHRIQSTEWLESKTRNKAVKKLESVYLGIGYPSTFPQNPKVTLNPEQFVKNVFSLGTASFERDIKKANTQLDPSSWEDSIFEVNAYYYSEGNRLILPAGILKSPFFDMTKSDGWNFGGIGAILGHELTHAFDMDGKNYDEHGNKIPWWTVKDNRSYNKKTRTMIALYNRTKYFNQNINGTLTLSENIADLGGVAIALTALKMRLDKKRVSKDTYKEELCHFFESYAVSWRTKEKRKKALQSIFTDVHSPPIARVNNIVRQFDEWYECFDVKPGQLLYTSPEERIRIF
jgi:putative endopeptidase